MRRRLARGAQVWAVALVLTFLGPAVTIATWALAISFGAPGLSAFAIAFGTGVLVAGAIGGVLRWLVDE